jgi:hypothetical protein
LARGNPVLHDNVQKLTRDRAKELGYHDALHALPSRVVDERGIRENVVGEFIAL